MKKTVRVINISEWIMIAAGSVFLIGMIQGGSSPILIGDETFSMKLVENSFSEIIRLTALDVHPPLYYILLKVVVELGNLVSLNPVISGKLASILPFLLLGVVSMTKIRKRFGGFAASFFFMSIMGMPQMMNYSVNIRMYSWGMFFVVMAFLAFCDIILENKFKPAILQFIIYSVMAAYTHYFACIGIAFLYFALLLYWYRYHREKIKTWFLCAAIICICYLPWIPIVYRQVGGVKEGYWIEPITLTSIIQFFQFLFNPAVYAYHSGTILGAALFLIVLAVLFLHGKAIDRKVYFCSITGIGVIFFIMFLGCLISMLVKPVLVQRYLFLGLGVLWLGTALGISQWKNKKVQAGIAIFALIIGILNFQAFIRVENEGRDGCRKLWQTLEEVEEGDVILSNFGQVRLTLAYLMPETKVCYYWRQHTEDLFKNMYGNLVDTRDEDEILSYLTTENKMYYFDVLEMEEFHFQNDCTYENITFKEIGKYLVEDVWVQVYEVTRR